MGSYEPSSLDSSLHVETMEGEDTGYNLDFSDTMCLFDETHISDSFVLQEFSNTQTADHQPIVEKIGISLTECVLNDDKEDFSKQEFTSGPDSKRVDSVDSYIYHRQPVVDLGRPDDLDVETYVQEKMPVNVIYSTLNIKSDSEHFDSLDSCIHQEEPLIGISRPEDLDIETHTQEIMPVSEYVGTAIFSSENVEGDRLCCLENVGTEHEDAVGSLAESVEIPMVSPSLATQPAENNHSDTENAGTQQNNPDDAKNALDLLEKTVGDHLRVNAEKQDLSDKVIQERHTEETSCILVTQSPNTAFDHPVDVPSSSPVLKISGAVDDSSWRQLATDNQERDLHSSNTTCSNLVDSSRLPVTEERDHIKPDLVHASTCSDVIISPPRRSTRRNKWCHQKSETGKTTASRGKTVNKKLLPGDSLLNAVRRKRSCPCKRARSSIWGSLGNVFRMKEDVETQKDGNHLILVENHKSHKRRVGPGKGRHWKTNAGSSLVAKEKSYTSNEQTSHVRLKVKMGGHDWKRNLNVQAEVLDSSISLPTVDNKCAAKPGNPFNLEIPEFKNGTKNSSEDDLYDNRQFTYADRDLEYSASYPGAHFLDSLPVDKDLESTVTQDTSVGNNFGNFPRGYSQIRTEPMDGAICTQYPDPGTSPDSEVISLSQDVGADAVLTTTQLVTSTDASAFNMELVSLGKQNKSTKVKGNTDPLAGYLAGEEKSIGQSMKKKPTDTSSLGSNGNYSRNLSNTERHTNGMLELGNLRESLKVETTNKSCELSGQNHAVILSEQLVLNGLLGTGKLMLNTDGQKSGSPVSARNRRNNASEKRRENSRKSANKRKVKKEDSLGLDFHNGESHREIGGGTGISSGTKEQSESWRPDVLSKTGTMELEICNDPGISIESNFASEDLSKSSMLASGFNGQLLPLPNAWVRCDDCYKWRCISTELADAIEATNCRWTCNENLDKAFADCSIPQEKSNAEINAELEITEFSGEEDASYTHPLAKGLEGKQLTVPQQAPWKPIESNIFLHRSRKTQIIDEIMICHCKPPSNGGLGCGDECLNRMLNIECVRGTCPCGDRCSNQQFQKRKYAKLECFRCGKKGHGLQLLESVSEGDFLIEYVGEVLDLNAYEARQREYASRGQKHFYFMTLNGSEVIDACVKGNLGRFINHSCDPNCRTEKWMVNGEVCIGLFAIRNIKKGEEVTFDYNYVRVFGAAAKRCVCGSSECRGYIGGDPLNTDAIVQSDSDEEYPEPVMVDGDGEIEKVLGKITSNSILSGGQKLQHTDPLVIPASSSSKQEGSFIKKEEIIRRSGHAVQPLEISPPKDDTANSSLSDVPPLDVSIKTEVVSLSDVPPLDISIKAEVVTNKSPSSIQPLDVSLRKDDTSNHGHFEQLLETSSTITDAMSKSLPDHVTVKGRSKSDIVEDKPTISKANSPAKSSRSIKKGKCRSNPIMSRKPPVVANKPKKLLEGAAHSGPKGVEEKLNELLDTDGSISKRKDAAKAYLKFLYVTASSGDNNSGEGVQSTRDLSIVLDALLKTKRRSVLNDVINKNGLQMLHNIMKQNRRNFNRIPIIRKLLRILELLAEKEILTRELINSGPPCAGMESFRESIIQLTRHRDVKVHQTARNFRDKWIPRTFRRNSYSDRDDINAEQQAGLHCNRFPTYKQWGGQGSRPMSGTDSTGQMSGATPLYANNQKDSFGQSFSSYTTTRTITRKRKSRWDQPEVKCGLETLKLTEDEKLMQEVVSTLQQPEITKAVQEQGDEANDEQMSHGYDHNVSQQVETAGSVDAMQDIQDDAPPGFPIQNPFVSCNSFSTATSNLSSDIHQRICSCEVVTGCHQERYLSHLPVSYGVPLVFVDQLGTLQAETVDSWEISPGIPFHPFPPLPPYPREKSKTPLQTLVRMEHGESQRDSLHASHQVDAGIPCTSGTRPSDVANTGPYNQKMAERKTRCSSGNLGRGYFRQQKWNIHPPQIRNRTECGFKGNNSRRGGYSLGVENVENGPENVCRTEDVGRGGEKFNSAPYQSPRHHYDH